MGVDPEVVAQQTAVCGDSDQLVAFDVTVAAFSARAGQLQGSPVLEVGGHLVVGHALDRPRGVRGLHLTQGVDLLQVPREEGTQAGLAQLGVENRGPLADVGVAAPGAGGRSVSSSSWWTWSFCARMVRTGRMMMVVSPVWS